MSTKHLVAWAVTFVVLLVIDMIWLGVVAKGMYQEAMGDLMSPNPRLAFAAVFYLVYPIGLLLFAIMPGVEAQSVVRAAVLGALFGMFCYATYDLTNLAVIRNWPLALSFIDIAWGTVVSGVAAAAGAVAWRWMAAR
ncbi:MULTISPECIES: DUF2177 family protein [Variovorax]|jgi:uncharacterized membrane protein|uniref:DUF2177 family protein n=1 Tax=Variovorax paradoxus TaxID=34073 RepID=A0AA91DMU5_VARPD|nr:MULTISPECIES: DUF2177 family protein [Variovorax]AVQ84614.1 DUF2177 domain-containing protein [Variovorax sp. PMC12]OAK62763.1 hypothetical protein A3K87_18135 [Variovorax paradoxus]QRY33785.1 DUF2177 family protein [Variovorax sp. PDNC026]